MAGDIDVVTSDIETSADKLQQAAGGVKTADPSVLVDAIAGALSGSASAGVAWTLGGAWRTRFSRWHSDAAAQHEKLVASAQAYDGSDLLSQSQLSQVQRQLAGPVR